MVNERELLLSRNVRTYTQPTEDAHRLLQLSKYVNANVPWLMCVRNTIQWIIIAFAVSGSYYAHETIWVMFTPKCWKSSWPIACHATGLCFWTTPLLGVLIAIITYWKHLYESRLYYECILHRIMMNYTNDATTQSPVTWIFVINVLVALCVVWFVASTNPFTNIPMIQALIVYMSPLVSFFMVFLNTWQVEYQLIPLPKFYETDPALAQEVLSSAVYATEDCMRVAFEEVEEALAKNELDEPLTSGQYFGLLYKAVETERKKESETKSTKVVHESWTKDVLDFVESQLNYHLAKFGMEGIDEYETHISRPEVLTWTHALRKGNWWVHRLLFSRNFTDDRAKRFRRWALAHNIFASVVMICVIYWIMYTIEDWFSRQNAHQIAYVRHQINRARQRPLLQPPHVHIPNALHRP